jgi:hypothetical protein
VEVYLHAFLTLALAGGEWLLYSTVSDHSTQWIGGWVDPRAGLDMVEKRKKSLALLGIEPQSAYP